MDALRVSALGSAALNALNPVPPAAQTSPGRIDPQTLAQDLFRRALQTAAGFPVAEPATGSSGLVQEAAASVLAALTAPPAAEAAPAAPGAGSAAPQAPSTAPSPTPPVSVPGEPAPVRDSFLTSSDPEFALQTALRFGAGVAAQVAPPGSTPDLATGLVRDPASVLRMGGLQAQAGGPGPQAFTHPQAAAQRALRVYQPALPAAGQVDLTA